MWCPEDTYQGGVGQTTYLVSRKSHRAYMKHTRNSTQATLLPKETENKLIDTMKEEKKKRWEEVITSIDLTHNSRKAWQTIKKLSNNPTFPNPPCLVNSNQVAHHLFVNGQGTMPTKPKCPALPNVKGNHHWCTHSVKRNIEKV